MKPVQSEVLIGGADPLDTRLSDASGSVAQGGWWRRTRPALGLAPTPMPAFVLLLCGILFGPSGLAVLSPRVLTIVGPAVSIGLAAVGVLIGLSLTISGRSEGRQLAAGWLEAMITMAAAGAALVVAAGVTLMQVPLPLSQILLLAICAAPSATGVSDLALDRQPASRPAAYGDVLAILLGGFLIMWLSEPSVPAMLWLSLNVAGIAMAAAVAGWLLVGEAGAESEQRVFAAGVLLLLGGVAAYLSSPALFVGLLAGISWSIAGGQSRERIVRDLRYVQHPLIVMLLLVAGASIDVSAEVFALALLVAVCRLGGKLAGAALASRVLAHGVRGSTGLQLISPGLVGIALALSVRHLPGSDLPQFVLSVIVAAVIVSDVMALLIAPEEWAR